MMILSMILNRYSLYDILIMSSLVIEMELIEVKRRGYLLQGSEVVAHIAWLAMGKRMTFTKE